MIMIKLIVGRVSAGQSATYCAVDFSIGGGMINE